MDNKGYESSAKAFAVGLIGSLIMLIILLTIITVTCNNY